MRLKEEGWEGNSQQTTYSQSHCLRLILEMVQGFHVQLTLLD